jgi:hypothetical protein
MRTAEPSLAELVDGMLVFVIGPVLGVTMCPGALLCAPALIAVTVPLVLVAVVAGVLAVILAMPFLLLRLLRSALTA